jgi:predicted  nucleic acid-binding Zn-ribbon protein
MAGTQSVKSPLARFVVLVIGLAVFGSIVASAHYFAIDLPAQKTPSSPKNTDEIIALQMEIENLQVQLPGLREQLLIKTGQMQKLKEQIKFVNNQVMGLDPVKDRQRYSEYEQQMSEYNMQLTLLSVEVHDMMSTVNNLENLISKLQKKLDELQKLEQSSGQ